MQRTHVLTAIAASVGTLTIAAALGFAQPDGLQPPPGDVMDTQPSLASIESLLTGIPGGSAGASTAVQFRGIASGTQVQIEAGTIRLERVIMQKGSVVVEDSAGVSLIVEAARLIRSTDEARFQVAFSNELNIDLVSPVTITGENTLNAADLIVVYKELP